MDQTILELTGLPNVKVGDEVEIVSPDAEAPNSIENLARLATWGAVVLPLCPGFYHRPRTLQDLFLNETARAHATVFLPACSTFEKDGTFMKAFRDKGRLSPIVERIPVKVIMNDRAALLGAAAHAAGL